MSLEQPNVNQKKNESENNKDKVNLSRRKFLTFLSIREKDEIQKQNKGDLEKKNKSAEKISRRILLELLAGGAAGFLLGAEVGGYDKVMQMVRKSWEGKEVLSVIAKKIRALKDKFPDVSQGINDEEDWAKAIKEACVKEGLERTEQNIDLILTIIYTESRFRVFPRLQDKLAFPREDDLRYIGVEPATGGPMGKSYKVLSKELGIDEEEAREKIDTLDGGIYYGVKYLKEILSSYNTVKILEESKIKCVFADYNAGIDSSKRAGIQRILNELQGASIEEDGILREKVASELKQLAEQSRIRSTIDLVLIPNDAEIDSGLKQIREKMINAVLSVGPGNYEAKKLWKLIEAVKKGPVLPVPANMQNRKTGHSILLEPDNSREYANECYGNFLMISKIS